MKHEERVELAKEILGKIEDKYKGRIVAGGIYGSVSRNEDTELSDLDLILITEDEVKEIKKEFLYKGMPVTYWSMELQEARDEIRNPDFGWPWKVNSLLNFDVIVGDSSVPEKLSEEVEDISAEDFKDAIREHLTNIYEYYFKVQKYYKKDEVNNLLFAVWDSLNGILGCVALINQQYFIRNDFYRFEESFEFDETPENYEDLVKKCYSSKDPDQITKAFEELFENFEIFLEKNGVEIDNYSDVDEIDI